ncbi:MAG: hypothetical protein ACYDAD_12260 [Acidimicrobiales bacterium]
MRRGLPKAVLISLMAFAVTLGAAGVAVAVSGGNYQPAAQDCPANADDFSNPNATPGCHNNKANVSLGKGDGRRYAELGVDQTPQDHGSLAPTPLIGVTDPRHDSFPHAGCAAANTNGTGGGQAGPGSGCGAGSGTGATATVDAHHPERDNVSPQTGAPDAAALAGAAQNGVDFYNGSDDNMDFGEHDGVDGNNGTSGSVNGPSDGGALRAHVAPHKATSKPSAHNPVPVAGASEGSCADGLCSEATTHRETIYHGGSNGRSRDVYNYDGKQWDPYQCSSGDTKSELACNGTGPNGYTHQSMDQWRGAEAQNVNAEPGVQVYEDPDPQGSPVDPVYEAGLTPQPNLYPLPGAYAGTCGVVLGGGPVATAPASPVTNTQGQVAVTPTGC